MGASSTPALAGRTAWARSLRTPLRRFLLAQTSGAVVLLAACVAALVWVAIDAASYGTVWTTRLAVTLGDSEFALTLREWVNSGLMTLFFFVVGLEARREFDMGELRERRRLTLPLAAGLGGMIVPVAIYLAVNAGRPSAHGWGVAMSTDTAFALGVLAVVGPRIPIRLRAFLLTVAVVDDIAALVVIVVAYSEDVSLRPLLVSVAIFGAIVALRSLGVHAVGFGRGALFVVLGVAGWAALLEAGVEPLVFGLAMGLLAYAYPAARGDLER
ncbi:MAG TPA: Na+/H+ antiporter NhaA, partial [Miltoncostaea sp.]|nr:Na+/H+ antiporter NhaA [Miltoncostaea sp.]